MSNKAKWIATIALSIAVMLILLFGGFTFTSSDGVFKQVIGVGLIGILPVFIALIWNAKGTPGTGTGGSEK
ncbi:MAG: hypothetical protein AB1813_17565 [Verrucomicrobiota bacterium]|jgi:hypothetical protein